MTQLNVGHEPPAEHQLQVPVTAIPRRSIAYRYLRMFTPKQAGAVYVLAVICIGFSIWLPDTFPTVLTLKQILNGGAVTAIAAMALVMPLATKTFDLSFAYTMSLAGVVCTHFIAETNTAPAVACLLGLLAALVVGVVNGFVVVVVGIDSFIGTLATGSLIQAFITYYTNDNVISSERFTGPFATLAQTTYAGLTAPVLYAALIAAVLWIFLEHTPSGRRVHAVGFNDTAARLANIRVERIRFTSLVVSAVLSGFGGLLLASTLTAGSPTAGSGYLLPAFAAVFVGATQFKDGRFNVWGSVVAVGMLMTGTVGLSLAGAPGWASNMFNGSVLLLALCATGLRQRGAIGVPRVLRRTPRSKSAPPAKAGQL